MSDRRDPDIHRLVMDWPDDAVAEIESLRSRLAEAERERDMWHARAISLFWNPGDETTCAVVRNDAALAKEWIKSRAPDSASHREADRE